MSHLCVFLFLCALYISASAQHAGFSVAPSDEPKKANCTFTAGQVTGVIYLSQESVASNVTVTGDVSGLSDGPHGFHVHEFGLLTNGCKDAGAHYNPFGRDHGAPTDEDRHVGDLGNIQAVNGVAHVAITDPELRLCGPLTIVGKSIVVHADQDDLGRGGNEESKKTGNAGARIGCCLIVAAEI